MGRRPKHDGTFLSYPLSFYMFSFSMDKLGTPKSNFRPLQAPFLTCRFRFFAFRILTHGRGGAAPMRGCSGVKRD